MKILFFIPSMYGGGAERVLKYLVENIEVDDKILCNLEEGNRYEVKNVKHITLTKIDGRDNFLKKIFYFPIHYIKFNKLLYNEKPDIIISFLERTNIITILSPTNSKKIISIRSFISKKFEDTGIKGKIVKIFYKLLFKKVKYFVVPTKEIRDDLIRNFKVSYNTIKVIYNPIDIEKINILKKEELTETEKEIFNKYKILINVGNLTYPKGQWHLLKVMKLLKKKNNNIKLVILGEGNYKDFLKKVAKELNLKIYDYEKDKLNEFYDIYLLGFKQNPYKYLYNADIFIFSSLREGFPNALIEAMACELPVISSDCKSGPKEILDNGKYGILLPQFNGNKKEIDGFDDVEYIWRDNILKIINNSILLEKYKSLSKKRVKEFELSKIIKIWEEYLRNL